VEVLDFRLRRLLAPETEQMHVPDRSGIGLVMDVRTMLAFTPSGTYRLSR